MSNGSVVATEQLRVSATAVSDTEISGLRRSRKRGWLKTRVACPFCEPGQGKLDFVDRLIRCRLCGETFSDNNSIFDFLPSNLKHEFRIEEAPDFSAHQYDEVATALIEEVRNQGGKILDCGSGLRSAVDETVVCLDVVALPAVDILAVNQKLPFQDAVFDAVLSLNVLEHVTNPFTCASELARVLKPGGALYCCIPFLQPEHGYPEHYFNATRSGLRQLFSKHLEVEQHFVPRSGEPMWTLHWFLSSYVDRLPVQERQRFLNMRFQDVVDTPPAMLLGEPWVTQLSAEGKWELASTTAAVFRKPETKTS